MKKYLLLSFLFLFYSCESYFGDVNENPNSPTDATLESVLTAVEVEMADWYGGELSRFVNMLTRQMEGVSRCGGYYSYHFYSPSSTPTMWENHYANILMELKYIKDKAVENNFYHYEGVANVLTAFQLMQGADIWNEMPWSEALQGLDNFTPVFDSQHAIYTEANRLLEEAIPLLEGSSGGNDLSGDLMHSGDADKWQKTAYALLARSAIHWSGVDFGNYAKAITAAQNGYTDNTDDLALPFPGTPGNEAPMYRFFRDRTGDMEFDPYTRQIMEGLNDSVRLNVLNYPFYINHTYFTADRAEPMMTYRELKFIEAEALLQTNANPADVRSAYLEGIRASFEHLGVESAFNDYVQQNLVDPGAGNITLDHILTQKFLGLYSLSEVYNDIRRTNLPYIQPTTGTTIPLRLPYPETEIANNPNVPTIDIFENNVSWDVN